MMIFNCIKNKNCSIVSNNCFGGMFSKKYGLRFNSPTVGLFIRSKYYIDFLEDIKGFSVCEIQQKEDKTDRWPVGVLQSNNKTIEINFMHYDDFQKAVSAWKRRMRRLDLSNMIIIYMQTPFTTDEDVLRFDALPYRNKIIIWDKNKGECLATKSKIILSHAFTWEPDFSWDFKIMNREVALKKLLKKKELEK